MKVINNTPEDRFRHVVLSLTDFDPTLAAQLPASARVIPLQIDRLTPHTYAVAQRAIRDLAPDIIHTRNIGTLEANICARMAGVPVTIHGEHGRDMYDLHGNNGRHRIVRHTVDPFVTHYTCVTRDLSNWLTRSIAISRRRITPIYNGVDTGKFRPREAGRVALGPDGLLGDDSFVVGTVGRMWTVKNQPTLARAFVAVIQQRPELRRSLRLILIGDGPLRSECQQILSQAGCADMAWLPGDRADVPELLRAFDLFVLPSLAEGMSNSILEAMASGLPVIATRTGGNVEIIDERTTGALVPVGDDQAIANAMLSYADNPVLGRTQGTAARAKIEAAFSIGSMVSGYLDLYTALLEERRSRQVRSKLPPIRTFSRNLVYRVAERVGINSFLQRRRPNNRLLVLCYHGVVSGAAERDTFLYRNTVSEREFTAHLDLLCRSYTPVSLRDVLGHFDGSSQLKPNSVLITFDDGLANNLRYAAPILLRYGVPAAFAVATGYIDTAYMLWADEVNTRVWFWRGSPLPLPNGTVLSGMPESYEERVALTTKIRSAAKALSSKERNSYLDRLRQQPCPAVDNADSELFGFMSWDQVRKLSSYGFDIGSHTVTHPILSQCPTPLIEREFLSSKDAVEKETGKPCTFIAYPNGTYADVNSSTVACARSTGYQLGFVLNNRFAETDQDPLALERLNVAGHQPLTVFQATISGLHGRFSSEKQRTSANA